MMRSQLYSRLRVHRHAVPGQKASPGPHFPSVDVMVMMAARVEGLSSTSILLSMMCGDGSYFGVNPGGYSCRLLPHVSYGAFFCHLFFLNVGGWRRSGPGGWYLKNLGGKCGLLYFSFCIIGGGFLWWSSICAQKENRVIV